MNFEENILLYATNLNSTKLHLNAFVNKECGSIMHLQFVNIKVIETLVRKNEHKRRLNKSMKEGLNKKKLFQKNCKSLANGCKWGAFYLFIADFFAT